MFFSAAMFDCPLTEPSTIPAMFDCPLTDVTASFSAEEESSKEKRKKMQRNTTKSLNIDSRVWNEIKIKPIKSIVPRNVAFNVGVNGVNCKVGTFIEAIVKQISLHFDAESFQNQHLGDENQFFPLQNQHLDAEFFQIQHLGGRIPPSSRQYPIPRNGYSLKEGQMLSEYQDNANKSWNLCKIYRHFQLSQCFKQVCFFRRSTTSVGIRAWSLRRTMDCRRRWAVDDDQNRRKWAADEDRRRIKWAEDDDRHRRRWAVDDDRRRRRWEVDDYPSLQHPLQWRYPPPHYHPLELPLKWRNPLPDHLVRNQTAAIVRDSPPLRPHSIAHDSAFTSFHDQDRNRFVSRPHSRSRSPPARFRRCHSPIAIHSQSGRSDVAPLLLQRARTFTPIFHLYSAPVSPTTKFTPTHPAS
ncbi:hypothetical protein M5K25_025734 [Dendrobium thyrsiflorum]|uniref:Uncharacterized protein n=1 Tax=Dendrobium thyrsiflorum TaxID=117978 RepID=A0ABD0U4R8_DENTH